ncbi:hypothetical protein Pfo_004253 [Paulownia fortunei]|nr:hypothetical protein Pfo_004253 [Paulownia fortunei]
MESFWLILTSDVCSIQLFLYPMSLTCFGCLFTDQTCIERDNMLTTGGLNFTRSKSVRFQDDLTSKFGNNMNLSSINKGKETPKSRPNNAEIHTNSPFQNKKLSRVFSEDYEIMLMKILNPRGPVLSRWNKCFLIPCPELVLHSD